VTDDSLTYDERAFEKRSRRSGRRELLRDSDQLACESFEPAALETLLNAYVTERGVGLGAIIHALRVAVTGKAAGPGMFDCLALVGRERCLSRIDRTLQRLG
jgi:glutamyl-tRNA synthetase